ncbi:hypothetical protein OQA88_11834 [Cercophora sp. LCS_1]
MTAPAIGGTAAITRILSSDPDQSILVFVSLRLVVFAARKPVIQYFTFQNSDEENLVQLLPGLFTLCSFLLPTLASKAGRLIWCYFSAISLFTTAVLVLNLLRPKLPGPSLRGFLVKVTRSFAQAGFSIWDAAFDIPRKLNRRIEAWEAHQSAISSALLPQFRYDIHCPLNAAKREIRVLRVQRRTWKAELKCDFICLPIEDAKTLPFEAISYTWDGEEPTENIIVNGCRLAVTPKVSKNLWYRRSFFSEAYLWIDGVCVDQGNKQEKSWQIMLMGEIYGLATRTLIWLAHPSEARESYQARELLFSLLALELGGFLPEQVRQSWRLWTLQRSPYIPALAALLSRNYFHRIWVVQEVALAQKVHIMYGDITMQWAILAEVVPSLLEPENIGHIRGDKRGSACSSTLTGAHPFNNISWHLCNIASMDMIRKMYQGKQPLFLYEILTTLQLRFFLATNPRDIFFGLLGLISDPGFAGGAPDYDEPVDALYTRTARYFIARTKSLSVLQYAGIGYKRAFEDLPSWVPDWSQPSTAFILPALLVDTRDAALYYYPSSTDDSGQDRSKIEVEVKQFDQVLLVADPTLPATTFEQVPHSSVGKRTSGTHDSGVYTDMFATLTTWIGEAKSLTASYPPTQRLYEDMESTIFNLLTGPVYLPSLKAAMREAKAYKTFQIALKSLEALSGHHQDSRTYSAYWPAFQTSAISSGMNLEDEGTLALFIADFCRLMYAIGASAGGKKFGILKSGRVALIPPEARKGDDICYIKGAPVTFLTRSGPKDMKLVGSCYTEGEDIGRNEGEWRKAYLA